MIIEVKIHVLYQIELIRATLQIQNGIYEQKINLNNYEA